MSEEQTPTLVTDDLRIKAVRDVSPPDQVRNEHPLTNAASKTVFKARHAIHNILHDRDDRLVVIVGPCSIHDPKAAIEYAQRLKVVRDTLEEDLVIVMRVYFEKPRTTVGWKGLINDPDMDNSFHINKGLRLARKLLIDMAEFGMPSATEYLDLISPQYVADVVSWGAIGARTTESQVHRELASGLSCPVGFKNGTDGNMQIAIDAIGSSSRPHHFLSVTKAGNSAIFSTTGNSDCHIILRGGNGEPNYDIEHIQQAAEQLAGAGLPQHLMVDCSHANSRKQHERQMLVARDIAKQISSGETRIFGVMLESHLKEGRQSLVAGKPLVYGQSITDACLSWEDTEHLLTELANAIKTRRAVSQGFGNA
jgi:3-deoxy-7-phosphoheptulonate synthase